MCICHALLSGADRKNENWESKLSFQAEEFLKEREQRDGEVKSWEKEKKRWKAFKTELETEVCFFPLSLVMQMISWAFSVSFCHPTVLTGCEHQVENGGA
jgi:hypothetical protein